MTTTNIRPMCDLIEPHLRHIRAAGFSDNTIDDRRQILKRVDRDLPMGLVEASVSELADWLAQFGTNQTKATYYGHIHGFFEWACEGDDPWLDWNPTTGLTRPKVPRTVPRPVTDDELTDVLTRAANPFRRWARLASHAGLRACEIATIDRRDISKSNITIRGKGGKNATVPTHWTIWEDVKDLPPGRLAQTSTGTNLTPTKVSNKFGIYLREELGVYGITLHRLRHWYGTTALETYGDLRVVQLLLRHSSVATTEIYTQITDGQRRSAIAALPALAPAST